MTISAEDLDIVAWVERSGVPYKVTDYSTPGIHVATSYHYRQGTGAIGLAVDLAWTEPSYNSAELLAIFAAFGPVESRLAELIYSGAPYNIKDGKRVPRYAVPAHWNHVHVAVPFGTILTGGPVPDDPNLPNIRGPVSFHPVVDSNGKCWGYYIFSSSTAELHSFGDPGHVIYYGRSEVVA